MEAENNNEAMMESASEDIAMDIEAAMAETGLGLENASDMMMEPVGDDF